MPVEIKFCGMTREADVEHAVTLGAAYIGVIFAESPRRVSTAAARRLARVARESARVVGVFGAMPAEEVAATAREAGIDIVQLHGDPDVAMVEAVRRHLASEVWGAVRIAGDALPSGVAELLDAADGVVLDARAADRLGGTGIAFDWAGVASKLQSHGPTHGSRARIVLAGGLTAENVSAGIAAIAPAVVDVSSGVESAPGMKDHARMRGFVNAVRAAEARIPGATTGVGDRGRGE